VVNVRDVRAILRNSRALILDDASERVDLPTEAAIRRGLVEAMRGRTTLVIATGRTISLADRVVLLDGGRVVADGTHEAATASRVPTGTRVGPGREVAIPRVRTSLRVVLREFRPPGATGMRLESRSRSSPATAPSSSRAINKGVTERDTRVIAVARPSWPVVRTVGGTFFEQRRWAGSQRHLADLRRRPPDTRGLDLDYFSANRPEGRRPRRRTSKLR
jgi:hypothetical protein